MSGEEGLARCQQFRDYGRLIPDPGDLNGCPMITLRMVDETRAEVTDRCDREVSRLSDSTVHATGNCVMARTNLVMPSPQA